METMDTSQPMDEKSINQIIFYEYYYEDLKIYFFNYKKKSVFLLARVSELIYQKNMMCHL